VTNTRRVHPSPEDGAVLGRQDLSSEDRAVATSSGSDLDKRAQNRSAAER